MMKKRILFTVHFACLFGACFVVAVLVQVHVSSKSSLSQISHFASALTHTPSSRNTSTSAASSALNPGPGPGPGPGIFNITIPAINSKSTSDVHVLLPHEMQTAVNCTGYCCHSLHMNNRSCHYRNLYLEVMGNGRGRFWAFVVENANAKTSSGNDGNDGSGGGGGIIGDANSLVVAQHTRLFCQGPFPSWTKSDTKRFQPHQHLCTTDNVTTATSSTDNNGNGNGNKSYWESDGYIRKIPQSRFDVLLFAGPKVKRFRTQAELEKHVQSLGEGMGLTKRPNVHAMFANALNWGHHTSSMYAAWMSLLKFGLENGTNPICFVSTPNSVPSKKFDGNTLSPELNPAASFGGCPFTSWEELTAGPAGGTSRWIHFDDFVFGIGAMGLEHRNDHYEASRYDPYMNDVTLIPRMFRDRMYVGYHIPRPVERSSSGENRLQAKTEAKEDGHNSPVELRALLVPNKRDWGDLNSMAHSVESGLASFEITLPNQTVARARVRPQILDWPKYDTLKSQLELLRETDIYVSSVGTALTLQSFLPDGSVVVNTGWDDGFWDEHLVASARFLGAVYPTTVKQKRSSDEVVALVREAATQIMSDFAIPVPRGSTLSRYGKTISTFLRSDEGKALHMLPMINFQYQYDNAAGSRSNGCWRVVGHVASAFYWACGSKYRKFNPRCHPGGNWEAYMGKVLRDNDLQCPNFEAKENSGMGTTVIKGQNDLVGKKTKITAIIN